MSNKTIPTHPLQLSESELAFLTDMSAKYDADTVSLNLEFRDDGPGGWHITTYDRDNHGFGTEGGRYCAPLTDDYLDAELNLREVNEQLANMAEHIFSDAKILAKVPAFRMLLDREVCTGPEDENPIAVLKVLRDLVELKARFIAELRGTPDDEDDRADDMPADPSEVG